MGAVPECLRYPRLLPATIGLVTLRHGDRGSERVTMPLDLNGLPEAISNGLSKLPSALVAAVLLGGPTAIWLITRFVRPPEVIKQEELLPEDRLWLCGSCLSINEERLDHCYRCHRTRAAESLPVIIHGVPAAPRIGITVGPAPGDLKQAPGWLGGEFTPVPAPPQVRSQPTPATMPLPVPAPAKPATAKTAPAARPAADRAAAAAPIEPVILEPKVKVSTRSSASKPKPKPPGRRVRPQPQGAGEAN